MSTYKITPKGEKAPEVFSLEAETYEAAANQAIAKMHKENNLIKVTAVRVSGEHSKSGLFQGYKKQGENGQNSVGFQFHVMEI